MKITTNTFTELKSVEISGECLFNGVYQRVIAINNNVRKSFSVATSICLPSNVDEARNLVECYSAAFKALDEHLNQEGID